MAQTMIKQTNKQKQSKNKSTSEPLARSVGTSSTTLLNIDRLRKLEYIHRILTPRATVLVLSPDPSMQKVWGRDTVAIDLVPRLTIRPQEVEAITKMENKLDWIITQTL